MLSTLNLRKSYKNRTVVQDISINVNKGEIVGLLGPNGAGKTTCFYMIVGMIQADNGSIQITEKDLTSLPMHQRAIQGLSYLPQDSSIFRTLSVADNIMAILETRSDLTKELRLNTLELLLEEFKISHLRDTIGMSLSGGERRRTEIARALATDPSYMLLDEPFAGVDPISVNDLKKIIIHLSKRNIGILLTDHNVRDTLDVCHRAYIVNTGKIIAEGNSESIIKDPQVKKVYLGSEFHL
ncbi:MAG: LPS export ABC transporter ATP-binding protein [Gammaproteobacteria bacterium]|nr:LPS export ABC transporter ATP-binding protein [Gammaproteobacteria bacterium]MDB2444243.1 LPS export ABC transporter ATP-binding protein [Gammaproteobacteria bacterium]MDG0998209.1 LPS export ABC transporter ATP-binding protein [Gammaproteobacteria bacterium]MDG1951449.1 LPS export ABC transporter ATP-binding protein [Gammaproteobacteria bacterium]MDG2117619.1 LPS export ABC transporter ATP-binding protein [Gammaproteobacteria bacterium]